MIKAQIVVNMANGIIICTAEDYGKTHDFAQYKNTIGSRVLDCIKAQADSGIKVYLHFIRIVKHPRKKPGTAN